MNPKEKLLDPENLAKLPKWAHEGIQALIRERDMAVRTLNEFQDSQKPSKIFFESHPCLGEGVGQGPTAKTCYVQSKVITIRNAGVELRVSAFHDDKIELSWGHPDRICCDVAFIPECYQSARIVHPDHMIKR